MRGARAPRMPHLPDGGPPMRRTTLAAGIACALSACLSAGALRAQDAAATDAGKDAKPAATTQLGQVTVTAQSRSQEMQDVPISMAIVTAQQVDKVAATDLSRMNLFVPGLVVDADDATQPTYRLRGIETSDFGIGTDSAVGVYVDGVYQTRSGGALMALNDVARVEVLKGPQGTLFGRNTAAGAISIVTNEPSDKLEGKARVRTQTERVIAQEQLPHGPPRCEALPSKSNVISPPSTVMVR